MFRNQKKCNSIRNSVTIYYTFFFASFHTYYFTLFHSRSARSLSFSPNVSPNNISAYNSIYLCIYNFLINPKSESSSTTHKRRSWEKITWTCTIICAMRCEGYMEQKNKTQESDMKISFRCFFDRMRCVCAKSGDGITKLDFRSSFNYFHFLCYKVVVLNKM